MRVKAELLVGNGIILFVFIAVSLFSMLCIHNLIKNSDWVNFTHDVINITNRIKGHIIDQETGVRGFMATGDESYLAPYLKSEAAFDEDLTAAKAMVDHNPVVKEHFEDIGRLATQWHEEVIDPYLKARREVNEGRQAQEAFEEFVGREKEKMRMDAFRAKWLEAYDLTRAEETKHDYMTLLLDMIKIENGLRDYLISGDEDHLALYFSGLRRIDEHFVALRREEAPEVDSLQNIVHEWVTQVGEVGIQLKKARLEYPPYFVLTEMMSTGLGKQYVDKIREKIAIIIDIEEKLLAEREESMQGTAVLSYMTTVIGMIIATLLIVAFVWLILRDVIKPIQEDKAFAQAIADGHLDASIENIRNNELGDLAQALNKMAEELRETNWLRLRKEGLDDELRGEFDVRNFVQRLMAYFTEHLDAQLGAVYVKEDDTLRLMTSHAFSDRKGNFNFYKLGEGMVGQAALDNKTTVFTNVEEDTPKINYGAGEVKPTNYMIIPISFENTVSIVLLLGSVNHFSRRQRMFVKQNTENVGILLNAAKSSETIAELLQKALDQQEELRRINDELEEQTRELKASEVQLQTQQEELRVANEELEEQAKELKRSKSELQTQQEELRTTNEELETHTQELEKQKEAIRKQHNDLVNTQKTLEQKARDLENASRYKSEFLANMSHELRTPLNSILILSQIFSNNKDGNLTQRQLESAEAIHSSGSELLTLINEILDLSKVEAGKVDLVIEDVKISDIVANINRLFQNVAEEKGVGFEIVVAEALPPTVKTDAQRLQQILCNLLSNAFKFSEQGVVTLHVSRPTNKQTPNWLAPESSIAFTVCDQGIGVPKEQLAAIFEAFQQADGSTSRKYGGTGLGLSISKELAKLLGGIITLESEVGKGSSFTIILPEELIPVSSFGENFDIPAGAEDASDHSDSANAGVEAETSRASETAPARAASSSLPPKPPKGQVDDDRNHLTQTDKCLLIIEDDPTFAKVIRDFAYERGFKVLVAEDGETGLHFADYYKPSAIILDIGLPGIDGWTVMQRLKENPELRHIPVHFMSAAESAHDSMLMGAVGYLRKPVTAEKVEQAFSRIEEVISKPVSRLLLVEDDDVQRESIRQLIGNGDVETTAVATGEDALAELARTNYDCMILDLGLKDMTGFELLDKIHEREDTDFIPIIVYTGRDLSREEEAKLSRYADSIIVKGVKSPERLLDESALFLHRVESKLPEEKRRMLKMVHNSEAVLAGSTVLLVDDDMRNLFALSGVLKDKSVNVITARNGIEALEKLKKNDGIDMVLMDIMMPQMDGYEAMREIRKDRKYANLPIIALTAKAMKGDRGKCIEAGANDYLAKPVNTDKLFSMMRVWLY